VTDDDADDADAELAVELLLADVPAAVLLAADWAAVLLAELVAAAEAVVEDEAAAAEAAGVAALAELAVLDDEGACEPAHPASASVAASAAMAKSEAVLPIAMFFLSLWVFAPAYYRALQFKQVKFYQITVRDRRNLFSRNVQSDAGWGGLLFTLRAKFFQSSLGEPIPSTTAADGLSLELGLGGAVHHFGYAHGSARAGARHAKQFSLRCGIARGTRPPWLTCGSSVHRFLRICRVETRQA